MREALIEFFAVISYSTKTQLSILYGLVFFVGILAAGDYFASHFELHGPLASMANVIREKIIHRYDKVGFGECARLFHTCCQVLQERPETPALSLMRSAFPAINSPLPFRP